MVYENINTINKTPKIIGITGGIGVGKTFLMNYLVSKNIPVYISDIQAKQISSSAVVLAIIKKTWGNAVLTDTVFDKFKLSKIVFEDSVEMKKLNQIIHPLVKIDWDNWLIEHKNFEWVAKESAILLEIGGKSYCDYVLNITAPLEMRIERILKRDSHLSVEAIKSRIALQWSDSQRSELSDFVIENISKDKAIDSLNLFLKHIKIM